jgi:23S rRNA (guanosine2251-2'-O)-methyltransferase
MKPPSDTRHGGSGRPPFNRSPGRGGGPERPYQPGGSGGLRPAEGGQSGGQGRSGGLDFRTQDLRLPGQGPRPPHGQASRDQQQRGPRPPHSQGSSHGQGQHDEQQRGPRPSGQGKDFSARPSRDGGADRGPGPNSGNQRSFSPRPQRHDAPRPNPADTPRGAVWLYGQHAVAAALTNTARRLRRLLLTEEAEAALAERLPPPWPLQPERVERGRIDQLLGRDIAHQGVALLADPLASPSLQHALDRTGPIVVLDQVTDPRNVGAILRAAASFGAAAVIAQDRNAPEETGALAKAASGALETMPLLRAVNIARTLIALKAANIWVVGLDAGGGTLAGPPLAGRRVALVLGAEGSGLRRLTRETCDEISGFAMRGAVGSLNVSAAAAVALYELTRGGN